MPGDGCTAVNTHNMSDEDAKPVWCARATWLFSNETTYLSVWSRRPSWRLIDLVYDESI